LDSCWKTSVIHPCEPKGTTKALGLWQARVNRNWRFYFTIENDEYRLHSIRHHPK